MATRMTIKGQVTIPKAVRKHLGLGPGSEVEFELLGDGRVIVSGARQRRIGRQRPAARSPWDAVRGTLKSDMTTDEIMKLLRGDR